VTSTASPVFSLTTRVAAARDQVSCQIDREAVILNLKDGVYYGLNEAGARVWTLVQERSHTVTELVAMIASEFAVSPEQCADDVCALLAQFHAAGLLEVLGEGAG